MIGEVINGKYRIETAFSESHMYEVFTALELDTNTTVVIKLLKEEMTVNPEKIRCFSDEIRSFASISHPAIAEVLDIDMYGDRPYVVSQLVSGQELYNIIKTETLSFINCCKVIKELATVLQFAAEQKIEHRTIKLSNVLRENNGKIKVLSFTHPRLKLAVRSPRSENSGIHSDLFFLGSTFFELLSGESIIRKRGGIHELWDMKLEKQMRIRHQELSPEQITSVVNFVKTSLTRDMKRRLNNYDDFLRNLDCLLKFVHINATKNKSRQLSMASQVVDAINGKMSNGNTVIMSKTVAVNNKASEMTVTARLNKSNITNLTDIIAGTAKTQSIDGNLALVIDNSESAINKKNCNLSSIERNKKPMLHLLKPINKDKTNSKASWGARSEVHWLRNPVIFMGICLVLMVSLIIFW